MNRYLRFFFIISLIMLFTLSNCGVSIAIDNEKTRPTLKGLKGVYIIVEDLRLEIEEDGLTRNQIHADTEQKLGKAGIKIFSDAEWRGEKGSPWLYIYAHVIRMRLVRENVYIFNISIELKQKVTLKRNPEMEVFVTTWSKTILGKSGYIDDIRKGIIKGVEGFIDAYLSENPRH